MSSNGLAAETAFPETPYRRVDLRLVWDADWNVHTGGALHGSAHDDLPPVLRSLTASIGIHHVPQLCSRIYPLLASAGRSASIRSCARSFA